MNSRGRVTAGNGHGKGGEGAVEKSRRLWQHVYTSFRSSVCIMLQCLLCMHLNRAGDVV